MAEVSLSNTRLSPIGDRILVRVMEEKMEERGGLIIPSLASERPQQGEVVDVGTGRTLKDGRVIPIDVEVGSKILFGKYAGTNIDFDNVPHIIIHEEDILAILE